MVVELKEYTDLASQLEAMERDGYLYFPGVLNSDEIAELRKCMDETEPIAENRDSYSTSEGGQLLGKFQGGGFFLKHIKVAFNRSPIFLKYIDRSPLIELAEAMHGEDCHIIGSTAWITGEGRPDQQLHSDWVPVPLPADVLADSRVKLQIFALSLIHI